jgi:hypothetical protein
MTLLIFCCILAVLFFWAVGAYNRLVVLRASVAKQFATVDAQLLRVLVWLQGNLPASMRDMLSEMEEAAKAEVRAGQSGEATWFIDPLPYKFDRLKAQAWPLMDAYNQAALKYNEAVLQFPASVLAKQVNFVPAQTLDIADLLA